MAGRVGASKKSKSVGAVVDEPVLPVQDGPVDGEQAAAAEAIAAALDPALVARLAAQARTQGCICWAAESCSR